MEDIPEIEFPKDIPEESMAESMASGLKRQLPVLEKNLNLFEDYFLNDWVHSKLPQNFVEMIEQLSNRVPAQRIEFIIGALRNYYFVQKSETNNPEAYATQNLPGYFENTPPSYFILDEMIRRIQGTLEDSDSLKAHWRRIVMHRRSPERLLPKRQERPAINQGVWKRQ